MWISRQAWNETQEQIKLLQERIGDLEKSPRIYADQGKLHAWAGGSYRLVEAVNQIAEHVGLRWKQQPAVKASLECLPEGKTRE